MNRNDPREQRAYSRRLRRLRARSRRESDTHSRRLRDMNDSYAEAYINEGLRRGRKDLDDDPGRLDRRRDRSSDPDEGYDS